MFCFPHAPLLRFLDFFFNVDYVETDQMSFDLLKSDH